MDTNFIVELINATEELADLKAKVSVLQRFVEMDMKEEYPDKTARTAAHIFGWEVKDADK